MRGNACSAMYSLQRGNMRKSAVRVTKGSKMYEAMRPRPLEVVVCSSGACGGAGRVFLRRMLGRRVVSCRGRRLVAGKGLG